MADVITGKTEVDAVAAEVIASIMQQELKQKSLLLGTVSDFSALATKGKDSVKIPRADGFTAEQKSENTALNAQALTFAGDSILLDQHWACQGLIEDFAAIQAQPDVLRVYLDRMASELAYKLDVLIYNQLVLTSASAPDHRIDWANAPTDTLTKADLIAARKLMKVANVSMDSDWFLAINPRRESEALALSDFVDADKWLSGSESAKLNGVIGRAYGFNILVTNVVSDDACVAYHKSHVGLAMQQMPRIQSQYQLEHLADRVSMDFIGGFKVLDSGKRGVLLGSAA